MKSSLLYLLIFLVPLVFNPFGGANPYELTKNGFVLFIIAVYCIFLFFIFLKKGTVTLFYNKKIFAILFLWLLSYGLSALFSVAPLESFYGSYERLQGFVSAVFYGIHFIICFQIFRDEKMQRWFFYITLACGLAVSLYAILQKLGVDPILKEAPGIFAGRSFALFGAPNALGQFLIFPIFISLFFAFATWKKDKNKSLFFVLALTIFTVAIFYTQNRASILGIAAALLFARLASLRSRAAKVYFVCVSIVVIAATALIFDFNTRSLGTRAVLWRDSSKLIWQNPIFGSGPETYYRTIQTVLQPDLYLYERMTDIPDRSHNVLLDVVLTRGFLGVLSPAALIIFFAYIYFRIPHKNLESEIAFYSSVALFISLQFSFLFTTDYIILTAMFTVLAHGIFSVKSLEIKRAIAIFPVAIALFALNLSIRLIGSDVFFKKAIASYLNGYEQSLAAFGKVISLSENYSYPYRSVFILFKEYAKTSPQSAQQFEKYAEQLGKITNKSFHYYMAKTDYASAAASAPNWPVIWLEWGEFLFKTDDYNGAVEKLERYVSLAPPYYKEKQGEKHRIFRISNQSFYKALVMLIRSYELSGETGDRYQELKNYL